MRLLLRVEKSEAAGVWVRFEPAEDASREGALAALTTLAAAKLEVAVAAGVVCDATGNRFDDVTLLADGDTAWFRPTAAATGDAAAADAAAATAAAGEAVCPHGHVVAAASSGGMHMPGGGGGPPRKYKWGDHDDYQFGDLTKKVLRGLKKKSKKGKGHRGSTASFSSKTYASDSPSDSASASASASAAGSASASPVSSRRPSAAAASSVVVESSAPGPRPRLIVGNVPDLMPSVVPAARRLAKQYGGIVQLTLLGEPLFIVTDPLLLPPLLSLSSKSLPRQEIAADGVFLADGQTWKTARQTLQLVFTDRHMHLFMPSFIRHAQNFCKEVAKPGVGDDFDVMKRAEQQMFDVVCEAGFGMKSATFAQNEPSAFSRSFELAFNLQKRRAVRLDLINKLPTSSNRRFAQSLAHVNDAVDDIVRKSSEASAGRDDDDDDDDDDDGDDGAEASSGVGQKENDLLSLMLAARHPDTGAALSHENLRHQVITLLVAGHKTASLLMTWATFEIAQHPHVEAELLREQASIFGKDAQRAPTELEVKQMRYLDQTLKETLRLHPPAQSVLRGLSQDDTDPEGIVVGPNAEGKRYRIPRGSRVLINVLGVHQNAAFWENPEDFDPSRFERSKLAKQHEAQYIPFGGGARVCLGNLFALTEVKVLLSLTLRQFQVRMHPSIPVTIKPSGNPLNPQNGVHTVWTPRDDYDDLVDTFAAAAASSSASSADPGGLRTLLAMDDDDDGAASGGVNAAVAAVQDALGKSTVLSPIRVNDDDDDDYDDDGRDGNAGAGAGAATAAARRPARDPKHFEPLDLVYGSNQGTCQDFAEDLAATAAQRGVEARVRPLDDIIDELEKEADAAPDVQRAFKVRTLIVCVSTYNGAPPDNAARFCAALRRRAAAAQGDLSHVEYAVFGSGNSNWFATFGKVPNQIDADLAALGGERIMPVNTGDEDLPSGLSVAFDAFTTLMWPLVGAPPPPPSLQSSASTADDASKQASTSTSAAGKSSAAAAAAAAAEAAGATKKVEEEGEDDVDDDPSIVMEADRFVVRRVVVGTSSSIGKAGGFSSADSGSEGGVRSLARSTAASAPILPLRRVLANRELQSKGSDRSTRYIEVELLTGESYEAGDHFEVQPEMNEEVVAHFASAVGLNINDRFTLRVAESQPARLLPAFARDGGACTVGEALRDMDCLAAPTQGAMLRIAERATDASEKKRLRAMALPYQAHLERFHAYVGAPCRTLPEILADFPSVVLSLADVLEILPPLRPRFYSISSAPCALSKAVSLCVGVATDTTSTGRVHTGICSSFLASQAKGAEIRARVRTSTFRLPPSPPSGGPPTTPLVFCCNGTGLAPFRGFLQELAAQRAKVADSAALPPPALLFFGCRNAGVDFIHRDELKAWQKAGVVTLHTAFSRDSDKKVYIQHKMSEAAPQLWDLLDKSNGTVMLCGDARTMAKGVQATLQDIAQETGGLSKDDASAFLSKLGAEDRLLLDVWG